MLTYGLEPNGGQRHAGGHGSNASSGACPLLSFLSLRDGGGAWAGRVGSAAHSFRSFSEVGSSKQQTRRISTLDGAAAAKIGSAHDRARQTYPVGPPPVQLPPPLRPRPIVARSSSPCPLPKWCVRTRSFVQRRPGQLAALTFISRAHA